MSESVPFIFDPKRVRSHRIRAISHFANHDFLFREAAEHLVDRLNDIKRKFPSVLELGSRSDLLSLNLRGKPGNSITATSASSPLLLSKSTTNNIVCSEELLPFAPQSFDAALSIFSLSTVNDLPGTFAQIRYCLKPDGLLLATFWGGQTLKELRDALETADMEIMGGVSPRIAPFLDVRDAGNLLSRAGFSLPVVDHDVLDVSYKNMFHLMHDLRGMGEANSLAQATKSFSRRAIFLRAAELYKKRYSNIEGRITATFEMVTVTAWAPHASQQQPAKRGSGKISLKDVL